MKKIRNAYKIFDGEPQAERPKMWGTGYKRVSMLFPYKIRHINNKEGS